MDNDEKLTSRDDETPPDHEAETTDGQDNDRKDEPPYESLMAAEKTENGTDNKISVRRQSSKRGQASHESDFGMPDYGFPEDLKGETQKDTHDADDALTAAKASLEMPPQEGTGWENTGSIEKPFLRDAKDGQSGQKNEDGVTGSQRSQAKVMPFPGSTLSRASELEPSEMLGARGEYGKADFFASQSDEPAEAVPDFDPAAHDSIADAVQSALKNMYGGGSLDRDDEPQNPGEYTVAESLRNAAAGDAGMSAWPGSDQDWQDDRRESYFGTERAAGGGEVNTEAVLDYLYSNRRAERNERSALPDDVSLKDYQEASGYDQDWPDDIDTDEREVAHGGLRDFGPGSYRGDAGRYAEQREDTFVSDRNYQDMRPNVSDWAPPYVSGGMPQGQYPAPMPTHHPESLAAGSPDSSHLLGAAGLGLIGGIALAGVLAVFVFNSFVDEGGRTVTDGPPKVVERLEPPSAIASKISEDNIAATEPSAEPQLAASPPVEPHPPAQEPPQTEQAISSDGKLSAADAAGEPGATIPLDIKLSDPSDQDATLISLKGLPAHARLSIGIDVGGGQWLLPPSRLDDLSVTASQDVSGGFDLEVQLLKDDAQTPLSEPVAFKLMVGDAVERSGSTNSVPPARAGLSVASADQAAQLAEVSDGTPKIETDFLTQMLIQDGNKLMRDGDILGARRLYEQAAANGNPEAALAMGRSYDPSYFEKLPVKTGKPDPATAFQWYKKALEGGLVTARVKIDGLKQWLQR